jgi:AcrR family transcriptional regulator
MPLTPTDRPTRKDAVRNRSRLIDAATSAFRERGLGVSVNAVARAAGVNVATLYRHFPTKDHLVAAVVRDAVRIQSEHGGIFDALGGQPVGSIIRETLRALAKGIAEPVVERAHRDGALREDYDAIDLLITLRMLGAAAGVHEPDKDIDRYVDVVLQGLRPS